MTIKVTVHEHCGGHFEHMRVDDVNVSERFLTLITEEWTQVFPGEPDKEYFHPKTTSTYVLENVVRWKSDPV